MVHGVVDKDDGNFRRGDGIGGRVRRGERSNGHSFFSGGTGNNVDDVKLPCAFRVGNHGVWSCKKFQGLNTKARWKVAKEKHLCFRYLGSDHQGKMCPRSKVCNIDSCKRNRHILLHDTPPVSQPDNENGKGPGEGAAPKHTHTSVKKQQKRGHFHCEQCSYG